jgi:hypothetical protein
MPSNSYEMSILDLQGLQVEAQRDKSIRDKAAQLSRSGHGRGPSNLSQVACAPESGLSVLLCGV